MRAVRFHEFGAPDEVIGLQQVSTPVPGPREVLVRVRARVINMSELYMVRGLYYVKPELPATPGYEGVGFVEATGASVTRFSAGDRVCFAPQSVLGTWKELVVADEHKLVLVPPQISDQLAAQYTNLFSAWVMTTDILSLKPGEWLLQTAANSALGKAVVQIGRLRGFRTLNVVRRPERVEEMLSAGAEEVVPSAVESIYERAMTLTGGTGVSAVLDPVAAEVGAEAIRCLKVGGTSISFAGIGGGRNLAVDLTALLYKGIRVTGFFITAWFDATPTEKLDQMTAEFWRELGPVLDAPIEEEYDLNEIKKAVRHADRFGRNGKILLSSHDR